MDEGRIREAAERDQLWASLRALLPEIERMAVDPGAPPELQEAVLRACHAEFGQLPPTATRPSILTVMEARRPLYELLRSVFSRITVLAHEELPPGTNVQPVARITATPS